MCHVASRCAGELCHILSPFLEQHTKGAVVLLCGSFLQSKLGLTTVHTFRQRRCSVAPWPPMQRMPTTWVGCCASCPSGVFTTASPPVRCAGNYANLLKCEGRLDDAEVKYRQAVASAPNNATVLGNYANFLVKHRGDYAAAKRMYATVCVYHLQ